MKIKCLVCGGKGWNARFSVLLGHEEPVKCRACGGTGEQKVSGS